VKFRNPVEVHFGEFDGVVGYRSAACGRAHVYGTGLWFRQCNILYTRGKL
jgi:hypothetical protein